MSFLLHRGFPHAVNLAGGVLAWRGSGVVGDPERLMPVFDETMPVISHVGVAWLLERAMQGFYENLVVRRDSSPGSCFRDLAAAEAEHQRRLEGLARDLLGELPGGLPESLVVGDLPVGVLEGGVDARRATEWATAADEAEIIELAASCETMAFDRFTTLAARLPDEQARRTLLRLADEERRHAMRLLGDVCERSGREG